MQVDAFAGRLGGNHDVRLVPKSFHQCRAHIYIPAAGNAGRTGVAHLPCLINACGLRIIVGAIEADNPVFVAGLGKQLKKIFLRAAGLGKDDSPGRRSQFPCLAKTVF